MPVSIVVHYFYANGCAQWHDTVWRLGIETPEQMFRRAMNGARYYSPDAVPFYVEAYYGDIHERKY